MRVPVAARSKARVCGRSLAGIADSNGCLSVVCVVCCQVEQYFPSGKKEGQKLITNYFVVTTNNPVMARAGSTPETL
jgi:hypothetical protein